MLFFKRIAYLIWSRRKKRVTVEEFLRWQQRAYPPAFDSASAAFFREHPILVDVVHACCHQGLRQPATVAGQSVLSLIHSNLTSVQPVVTAPSADAVLGDIYRLESSHPSAFYWLRGAALAYTGRAFKD